MTRLSRYLFIQCAGPLFFFTVVLSGIVWLSQSLNMLDLVINKGQSAATFTTLSILVFPSLLTVVLPIALFCGVLYALHKLYNDSEIVVMWAAGYGRWPLALPVLALAGIVLIVNLFLNLYLMPAGYRAMKDKIYEIRSDIIAQLINEGTFSYPTDGLTVYIREITSRGELKGLLVHDNRDPLKPLTYMAETGRLAMSSGKPLLVMVEGSMHAVPDPYRPPTITGFETYSFDLSEFAQPVSNPRREYSERYLHELLTPKLDTDWERKYIKQLHAEGHNRLAAPLYNIAFAMVAIVAVVCGGFSRRGYPWRITIAMVSVVVLRILGFAAQSAAGSSSSAIVLQYLFPLGTIVVCAFLLTDWSSLKERSERFLAETDNADDSGPVELEEEAEAASS